MWHEPFRGGGERMMANGSDFTELKEDTLTHLKKTKINEVTLTGQRWNCQ